MRTRRITATALIAVSILAMTALAPTAAGASGRHGRPNGVWCYTPDLSQLTPVPVGATYEGPKLFFTTFEEGLWTGTFEGVSTDYGALSLPSGDATGPTMGMLTVVFDEVEVRGRTGGLELDAVGGRLTGTGEWDGTWVVTSASGDLEGLEGHGTWWGPGYSLDNPTECGVIYYAVERLSFSGRGR